MITLKEAKGRNYLLHNEVSELRMQEIGFDETCSPRGIRPQLYNNHEVVVPAMKKVKAEPYRESFRYADMKKTEDLITLTLQKISFSIFVIEEVRDNQISGYWLNVENRIYLPPTRKETITIPLILSNDSF